jgi:hypothetical protein
MGVSSSKAWICPVYGYIHHGSELPEECPVYGSPTELFEPYSEIPNTVKVLGFHLFSIGQTFPQDQTDWISDLNFLTGLS